MNFDQKRVEIEAANLAKVMSAAEGRWLVWHVLSIAGAFRQSYVPDSDSTAFNEGQRSVGLRLYGDLQMHCPEQFLLMQREAAAQAQKDRREIEDERTRRAASAE